MVNFYIVHALGQNLANSESCPILRLLLEAQMSNFRDLCVKKPYGKLSIVMKCPYKFDESENVHRVKCP
jgi:hypothetical protein